MKEKISIIILSFFLLQSCKTDDIELYDENLNDFNKDGTQNMWAK